MEVTELLNKLDAKLDAMTSNSEKLRATLEEIQSKQAKDDERRAALEQRITDLASKQNETVADYLKLKAALQDVEKKGGVRTGAGAVEIQGVKRLRFGRMFAKSEEYKHWKDTKSISKNSRRFNVGKSFFSYRELEAKASDSYDDTTAGVLKTPFYREGIVEQNKRVPVHRSVVNVLPFPANTDRIVIRRELVEHMLIVQVKQAQTAGNNTLVLESVGGLLANDPDGRWDKIVINNTGGPETKRITAIDSATKTITLNTNLANDVDVDDTVTADLFAFTPEGTYKPKSLDTYEDFEAVALTLASWVEATNQIIDDATLLADTIERKLMSKLSRNEEKQFFYGPGGANNWTGLFNSAAGLPKVQWSLQPVGTTKLDLLLFAMVVVQIAEHTATACFINPQDMRDVLTTKGTDGHYVFMQVMVSGLPPQIWTMRMITTNAVDAGDAVAGDFEMGVTIYDREEGTIRIGEPEDYFFKNSKAILAEQRAAMAIEIAAAMVYIEFDSAPTP